MDQDKRMAEMEELLREIVDGTQLPGWMKRADAVLAPAPDPDASWKEVANLYHNTQGTGASGWRAVTAWADKRVRDARIAALREARAACSHDSFYAVDNLVSKAEADDGRLG